jgi:hypothetical protein
MMVCLAMILCALVLVVFVALGSSLVHVAIFPMWDGLGGALYCQIKNHKRPKKTYFF